MNNIKEKLRFKLLGQLSNDKTDLDVYNAYSVVKEVSVAFSSFFAENCFEMLDSKLYYIRDHPTYDDAYKIEDIFYFWENDLLGLNNL